LTVIVGALFLYQHRFYGAGYPSTLPKSPAQPIAFSHRIHAAELEIDCLYCHGQALQTPVAGLPTVKKCRQCHAALSSGGFEGAAASIDRSWRDKKPIPWVRVYDLPAHVYFSHRIHLKAQLDCADCHGSVEQMNQIRRVTPLSMRWCVDCHESRKASVECSTCHI
jgi:c(7)-type cytochrome triheme protein